MATQIERQMTGARERERKSEREKKETETEGEETGSRQLATLLATCIY